MTPYKIITLYRIHREFNPDKFKQDAPQGVATIDLAFEGL